jgi:subtilisin family serine protease
MNALELVKLTTLMEQSSGRPEVVIGLIDGPVLTENGDLWSSNVRHLGSSRSGSCAQPASNACMHGTLVAGMLVASRGSVAPAICPACSLLVRPIFPEITPEGDAVPSATPKELATAIVEVVEAGVRVINLSAALVHLSARGESDLEEALDCAMARGVVVVAAAGNQGTIGSSAITRHPWVIPVAGCDLRGRPIGVSNFGSSTGRRGLSAPAEQITSITSNGEARRFSGTSAAAPFVTGTAALLWSEFPTANAYTVKHALLSAGGHSRETVVPPILNASAAYQFMGALQKR